MFDKVADYIHVARGAIPSDICAQLLAMIKLERWQANTWYDQATQQTYSENTREPDALFANETMHQMLGPAITQAARSYVDKFAYKDSPKTSQIITAFSNVRFNRYVPGQIMRKHHDHIHAIFDGTEKGIPVLSFVGNLNEDYEGGELAFFEGQPQYALKTGDICMFPSCFLYPHEVLEVRRGERYSFAMWAW